MRSERAFQSIWFHLEEVNGAVLRLVRLSTWARNSMDWVLGFANSFTVMVNSISRRPGAF